MVRRKNRATTQIVGSDELIPEGFLKFFVTDSQVPDPPSKREQMRIDELGVSFHYCYALESLGKGNINGDQLAAVDRSISKLEVPGPLGPLRGEDLAILKALDDRVFYEVSWFRKVYGPISMKIGPLTGNVFFEPKAYLMVTVHSQGLLTLSLAMNLTGTTADSAFADQIQSLQDAYFYNTKIFTIGGKQIGSLDLFEQLRQGIAELLPDLRNIAPCKHVSIGIGSTTPLFRNARVFAKKHAYEMIAMLGEEADWRVKTKSTVREILAYGLSCGIDDVVVPQEFASVAIDGSPDKEEIEAFSKFGTSYWHVIDVHSLAAWTALRGIRILLDAQIEACSAASQDSYRLLIQRVNRLLSRYLRIRQSFTNIDHIWKDSAFAQYADYKLEQRPATRRAVRKESLDATMDTLRALTSQMADMIQRQSESRTNRALQIVGLVLSGTAIFDVVKLAVDAYKFDAATMLQIGLGAWLIVALLVYLTSRTGKKETIQQEEIWKHRESTTKTPSEQDKKYMKQCQSCYAWIPMAAETCEQCGTKQKK